MKTYVVCTTLENDTLETLSKIGKNIDISQVIFHFIKIVEIQVFSTDLISAYYPTEEDRISIESVTNKVLKKFARDIGIDEKNVIAKCFFETNREEKILDYLKEVKADLVVTATKRKHGIEGFFSSSFTDFLCKFSPCDILVMRPHSK